MNQLPRAEARKLKHVIVEVTPKAEEITMLRLGPNRAQKQGDMAWAYPSPHLVLLRLLPTMLVDLKLAHGRRTDSRALAAAPIIGVDG